jgi:hypothetical protein
MPRGPRGEKQPADVIGNAVRVMQIVIGEIPDNPLEADKEFNRKGIYSRSKIWSEVWTNGKRIKRRVRCARRFS